MIQRLRRLHPSWRWVGAAMAVGFVLRVVWVVWVAREPQGLVDPVRYLGYARNISAGRGMTDQFWGFATAYYPPGYPWFLGIVAWASKPLTADIPLAAGLVQAVLGTATVLVGALVARRLAGPRAAVAAAWGLALYPNLIFHTGVLLGETLYNALFLGFCLALLGVRAVPKTSARSVALAGGLLGLAVMVRPISLAVIPVAIAFLWLERAGTRHILRSSALLVAMVVLCIVPWTVRNAVRMDSFVLISTNTGDNLCLGHGSSATGAFHVRRQCATEVSLRTDGPKGEVAADKEKVRIALRSIADDPGREPWLLWRRVYFMWIRDGDHDGALAAESYRLDRWMAPTTEARLFRVADVAYWAVLALGAVGLVGLGRRRGPADLFILGATLMTALVPLAFFGDSRFKVPVIPLLIIAGSTVFGVMRFARGGRGVDPDPARQAG